LESAGQHEERHLEDCMVCGSKLIYQTHSKEITCNYCGKTLATSVFCPDGHYVCDTCHGAGYYGFLEKTVLTSMSKNPMEIAEILLQGPSLPSLGAEHHAIVAASLLAALGNYGEVTLSDGSQRIITHDDIRESIRRMQQIPACTCAYHGACGAGLGVGAFFSILYEATCAKDIERTLSMRASNAALAAIANTGGPGCCKQSVRTAVLTGVELLKEFCNVKLPISHARCFHMKDTAHGCKGIYCQFSR
jgi:hypothetical protein